jgi:hypothetical protein
MRYFNTHAGKSVLLIGGAALLLAWPAALPWVAAVIMLQSGAREIRLAFREVDRDVRIDSVSSPSLPSPDHGERGIANLRSTAIRTRP